MPLPRLYGDLAPPEVVIDPSRRNVFVARLHRAVARMKRSEIRGCIPARETPHCAATLASSF
jgi:hypothetical protein